MMSELSARLLAGSGISFASSGYAGDVDDRHGQARRSPTAGAATTSASAPKQPSAPRRPTTGGVVQAPAGTSARPPSYIQMMDGGGRQHHFSDEDAHHQKRRKLHHHHHHHHHHARNAEATYVASTVLKDLSKGGLSHKRLIGSTKDVRPSSLLPPNSQVNMSRVNVITSKDYDLQEDTNDKTNSGFRHEVYGGGPDSDIFGLLRDCNSFYRALLKPQLTTAAVDDHNHAARTETKASGTDRVPSQSPLQQEGAASGKHSKKVVTISDECLRGEAMTSVKECNLDGCSQSSRSSSTSSARSEAGSCTSSMTDNSDDGSNTNNEDGPDGASSNQDASEASTSPSGTYIRMGDALSTSHLPRLIALSFKPFVVVHVNGKFTDLTGQNSIGVLGKPLHDMFAQDPLVAAALQTSCQQFTLASLDGQAIKMIPSASSTGSLSDASRSTGSDASIQSSSSHNSKRGRRSPASLCTIRVRPIGQDGESGHITHYLLEIVQVGDKDLLDDVDASCGDDAAIRVQPRSESESPRSHPMRVMA